MVLSGDLANSTIDCSQSDVNIALEFLISKYASFQAPSLLSAFDTLFERLYAINGEKFMSNFVRVLGAHISRSLIKVNAVSNYHTLLRFVNRGLAISSTDNEIFMQYLTDLIRWQALLLDRCLTGGKRSVQLSVIRNAKRVLKEILQHNKSDVRSNRVETIIKVLVGTKMPSTAAAISLGLLAGVCKGLQNDANAVIESSKDIVYGFFSSEIVGSKSRIPSYAMVLLGLYVV